jgi:hypothetical protein
MKTILITWPVMLALGLFGGFLLSKNRCDSRSTITLKEGINKIIAKDQQWMGIINNQTGNFMVEFHVSGAAFSFRSDESGDVNAVYLPPNGKPVVLDRNGHLVDQ